MRRIALNRHGEQGAVAVLVAILMTVLLGFAAFGIDIANMASDKQQLQNGADAAALAIAQSCAKGDSCDNASGDAVSTDFAAANRLDGDTNATVDGYVLELNLAESYVKVETVGLTNHWFAQFIGRSESQITARAKASWAAMPAASATLPVTISWCSLLEQDNIIAGDDGSLVFTGADGEVITIYTTGNEANYDCEYATGSAGSIPGGFAILDSVSGDGGSCYAETTTEGDDTFTGSDPGNDGLGNACDNDWLASLLGQEVLVPVFDYTVDQGQFAEYHIVGYATFVLLGYNLNPGQWAEYIAPLTGLPCKGSDRCIAGRFVEWSVSDVDTSTGTLPYLGTTVVTLVE